MTPGKGIAVIIEVILSTATVATAADGKVQPRSATPPPMRKERASPADTQCGTRTLAACTQERVAALQRLSAMLKQAAAQKPSAKPADAKTLETLERYDRWLTQQSEQAARLATEGQRALTAATPQMQEMHLSFHQQYLELQQKMQRDNRAWTMVSNIMKTKHDAAKSEIDNLR